MSDLAVTKDALARDVDPALLADLGLFSVATRIDGGKEQYLLRPDLGRRLSDDARRTIAERCANLLETTLRTGERAVIAGHSMGGIAISSWAARHPDNVGRRADAVALINTTTGDLLEKINLLRVPGLLAGGRTLAARRLIKAFGGAPVFRGAQPGSRRFVAMMAVGPEADPAIADFVHDLFAATPPAGRGAWARVLVDELGPQHIDLSGLSVPALVIGSHKDRLLPMCQARKIAAAVPNLVDLVELPGGHCAILEHPESVNRHLRMLAERAVSAQRISS